MCSTCCWRVEKGLLEIDFSEPGRSLVDAALATDDFCQARTRSQADDATLRR